MISLIDSHVCPLVVDHAAHLIFGIILVNILSAISTIGTTGVFVDPVMLAVLGTATVFIEEDDNLEEGSGDMTPVETYAVVQPP